MEIGWPGDTDELEFDNDRPNECEVLSKVQHTHKGYKLSKQKTKRITPSKGVSFL